MRKPSAWTVMGVHVLVVVATLATLYPVLLVVKKAI